MKSDAQGGQVENAGESCGAAECRIRARDVAAPSALAEGLIPPHRSNPSRSVARANSPPSDLTATGAAPSSGSRRNRMTLFVNPKMHYSIFHMFPWETPRVSVIRIDRARLASRLPHYNITLRRIINILPIGQTPDYAILQLPIMQRRLSRNEEPIRSNGSDKVERDKIAMAMITDNRRMSIYWGEGGNKRVNGKRAGGATS
jgi:hypothetical protein